MIDWLEKLDWMAAHESAVIMVTVVTVYGSAPREIGAKILVSATRQWGSIGGGNLEYKTVAIARELLAAKLVPGKSSTIREFALGPALGQCCGGRVELLFESVSRNTEWLQHAVSLVSSRKSDGQLDGHLDKDVWLCRSIINPADFKIAEVPVDLALSPRQRSGSTTSLVYGELDLVGTAGVDPSVLNDRVDGWCCETLDPVLPEVWVFGAGHVGRALLIQLQLLPCKVVVIDGREELLQNLPEPVRIIETDCCAAEVADAPAGAWFIVMTHSHAIDFDICLAILLRDNFSYLGLIGSATKKTTFDKRLAGRGIEPQQIDRLTCPIGLASIRSRQPQLIALGVAADLSLRWQDTYIRADGP